MSTSGPAPTPFDEPDSDTEEIRPLPDVEDTVGLEDAHLSAGQEEWASEPSQGWAPETSQGEWAPDPSQGEWAPETSQREWAPETSQGEWAPDPSQGDWAPDPSRGEWAPDPSRGEWAPDPSQGDWAPDTSYQGGWAPPDYLAADGDPGQGWAPPAWQTEATQKLTPQPAEEYDRLGPAQSPQGYDPRAYARPGTDQGYLPGQDDYDVPAVAAPADGYDPQAAPVHDPASQADTQVWEGQDFAEYPPPQDTYETQALGAYPAEGQDAYPTQAMGAYPAEGQDAYATQAMDPYPAGGQDTPTTAWAQPPAGPGSWQGSAPAAGPSAAELEGDTRPVEPGAPAGPRRRRLLPVVIGVAALVLVALVVFLVQRASSRTPTPVVTAAASVDPALTTAGTCWATASEDLTTVQAVDCSQPHGAEVLARAPLASESSCAQAVAEVILPRGMPGLTQLVAYVPSSGTSEAVCVLTDTSGAPSLEGSLTAGDLTRLGVAWDAGECLADRPEDPTTRVDPVDCTDPHALEWLGEAVLTTPKTYDEAAVAEAADAACWNMVTATLGRSRALPAVRELAYYPSAEEWDQGVRGVSCAVEALPGRTLVGAAGVSLTVGR